MRKLLPESVKALLALTMNVYAKPLAVVISRDWGPQGQVLAGKAHRSDAKAKPHAY